MTPKERASVLMSEFEQFSVKSVGNSGPKVNAIKCVKQILNALRYPPKGLRQTIHIDTINYWKEVIKELEELL